MRYITASCMSSYSLDSGLLKWLTENVSCSCLFYTGCLLSVEIGKYFDYLTKKKQLASVQLSSKGHSMVFILQSIFIVPLISI